MFFIDGGYVVRSLVQYGGELHEAFESGSHLSKVCEVRCSVDSADGLRRGEVAEMVAEGYNSSTRIVC